MHILLNGTTNKDNVEGLPQPPFQIKKYHHNLKKIAFVHKEILITVPKRINNTLSKNKSHIQHDFKTKETVTISVHGEKKGKNKGLICRMFFLVP